MPYVKYIGTAHIRLLDAADLKKFGVEGFRKTEFKRDEAVKVDERVADALLLNLSDEFDEADGPEDLETQAAPAAAAWVDRPVGDANRAPENDSPATITLEGGA